jgi:hypothetical protein
VNFLQSNNLVPFFPATTTIQLAASIADAAAAIASDVIPPHQPPPTSPSPSHKNPTTTLFELLTWSKEWVATQHPNTLKKF